MNAPLSILVSGLLAGLVVGHSYQPASPTSQDRGTASRPAYPLSHQQDPSNLPSRIALCTPDEPGETMVISGTVYDADGVTPVAGALVYLYQTDARGVYSEEESNNGRPRLRGYLRTAADGTYEIMSIKPGHYPHIKATAHVHVQVSPPGHAEYASSFVFYDDPLHSDERRAAADKETGDFGLIRLTAEETGVLRGVQNIKPPASGSVWTPPTPAAPNPELEAELRRIMLEIAEDFQHGSMTVFARYGRGIARAGKFTFTNEVGRVRLMPPAIPMHPLETRATELTDVQAREHGDTVILSYKQTEQSTLKGNRFTKATRKTVVFVRRDGNWQIVAMHSSPIGAERTVAPVDPVILDSYAGRYENPLWGTSYVAREGNAIVFTSASGYRTEYLPESETEFFEKDEGDRRSTLQTITFVRNATGRVTHCVFRENDGRNVVVRKIE